MLPDEGDDLRVAFSIRPRVSHLVRAIDFSRAALFTPGTMPSETMLVGGLPARLCVSQ